MENEPKWLNICGLQMFVSRMHSAETHGVYWYMSQLSVPRYASAVGDCKGAVLYKVFIHKFMEITFNSSVGRIDFILS